MQLILSLQSLQTQLLTCASIIRCNLVGSSLTTVVWITEECVWAGRVSTCVTEICGYR
ncbi:hypothetical protein PROFUN_09091 [Planoprotostelium fungivorum]|uniref:Uncharacterized protein n=1 Tax=Planoprotostelium fungivorum TaxID=1890364 RepID=A0A2P6NIJ7_9EUKA|nr:hypothetical protein PROFUN_09091 [Planoprotostelium fungivorum]